MVFLSLFRQLPGLVHDRFLPYYFKFIIHQSPDYSALYNVDTDSVVKPRWLNRYSEGARAGRPRNWGGVRFPTEVRVASVLPSSNISSVVHPSSCSVGSRVASSGGKAAGA
jgi:hypothetical protein